VETLAKKCCASTRALANAAFEKVGSKSHTKTPILTVSLAMNPVFVHPQLFNPSRTFLFWINCLTQFSCSDHFTSVFSRHFEWRYRSYDLFLLRSRFLPRIQSGLNPGHLSVWLLELLFPFWLPLLFWLFWNSFFCSGRVFVMMFLTVMRCYWGIWHTIPCKFCEWHRCF
jgi:hypothetical protein